MRRRSNAAFRLLRERGTRALVIDEINSLLAGTPRQQRISLQLLRFPSPTRPGISPICAGSPEARQAMLTDPQLRSRFLPYRGGTTVICRSFWRDWCRACLCIGPRRSIHPGCGDSLRRDHWG